MSKQDVYNTHDPYFSPSIGKTPRQRLQATNPAREKAVEAALVSSAKKNGGDAFKWVSPGCAGVPDRIVLLPVPECDRATVAKYVRLVECKSSEGEARPLQKRMLRLLALMGYRAEVVASVEEAKRAAS